MGRLQTHLTGVAKFFRRAWRDESGVAVLVIIAVVAVLAAVTTAGVVMRNLGTPAELRRSQVSIANLERLNQAILLAVNQDTTDTFLPCPASGSAANGVAVTPCDTAPAHIGTVPWASLGIPESWTRDSQGNQIVYIRSTGGLNVCEKSGGNFTGNVSTGNIVASPSGSSVLYALISQGGNGRGAFTSEGTETTAPGGSGEQDNCPNTSVCSNTDNNITTGPFNSSDGTDHFDDQVLLASENDFTSLCASLAAASTSEETVFINDGFDDGSGDGSSDDIDVNVGAGGSSSEGSGVLTVSQDVEIVTDSDRFNPSVTPLYISIEWTPTAGSSAGFSIVTRADPSSRDGTTSDYDPGITVNFFGHLTNSGDPAFDQYIEVVNDSAPLEDSDSLLSETYDLNIGTTYELEVFDDGTQVWARITEVGDTGNQATVYVGTSDDLAAPNNIIFLHTAAAGATSELDNLFVAKGIIALEIDDGGSLDNAAATPLADMNDQANYSLDTWIHFRDTPAGDVDLFSAVDGSLNSSTFELDAANNELEYQATGGVISTLTASQTFAGSRWYHVAFSCADGVNRDLLVNGSSVGSDSGNCDILPDGTVGTTESTSIANNSGGRIVLTESRLWSDRLDGAGIDATFDRRAAGTETDLRLQLRMEDAFGSSTAADSDTPAENYDLTDARFVGFYSPYVTNASEICPSYADATDDFKCVFDGSGASATTFTFSIPLDVAQVQLKAWGGGGGGGTSSGAMAGGGGGYAEGILSNVGGEVITGGDLLVTAAGAGQNSPDNSEAGGGGGGSAVRYDDGSAVTLMLIGAGGGGGGTGNNATAGGGGGGTAGVAAAGSCGGGAGTQAVGGTGQCGGTNGGAPSLTGANGGVGEGGSLAGAGGAGFGNGGNGTQSNPTMRGGGGGGGYSGGGGGGQVTGGLATTGGGGGGAGYENTTDLDSSSIEAAAGVTPGNSGDADRTSNSGDAGAGGAADGAGSPGRVVICWSETCLP